MKKILFALAILVIIAIGFYFVQNSSKGVRFPIFSKTSTATIDGQSFKVTVATSQKDQEIGLSETKSISQNQGMLFIFKKPDYYSFWMKNMKFPIDIIYINQDTIVTIKSNVASPKNNTESLIIYTPTEPADRVLEIQAGLSDKYHFKNGDKVKYENIGN